MINMTALGLGGIAAALTAGWQQVKNAIGYVSSFVIVKATFDHYLSPQVFTYIKRNYKPLPSGLLNYVAVRVTMKGKKQVVDVPFRIPAKTAIYVRGLSVFIVSVSDTIEIRSIRGLTNFDKFTSDALDSWQAHIGKTTKTRDSRFYVKKIIGEEKNVGAARRHSYHDGDSEERSPSPAGNQSSGSSALMSADITTDRSFKYTPEQYALSEEDDPLEGLFFDDEILKYFDQAMRWLQMGDWYLDKMIPWRRGWLLTGPGGTGKSSIAKALAQSMGIPICHFYLATLSDQEFMDRWDSMPTPCVALFEDFDNVFHGRENQTEHKSLTFDCILNQISGVSSLNGVFLIVTTNHIEHIDPALGVTENGESGVSTRPGRIDTVISVSFMNAYNRRRLATKILKDWPDQIERLMTQHPDGEGIDWTPSQWQEMCIQIALEQMQSDERLASIAPVSVQSNRPQSEVVLR
jgi:hypothetical protein